MFPGHISDGRKCLQPSEKPCGRWEMREVSENVKNRPKFGFGLWELHSDFSASAAFSGVLTSEAPNLGFSLCRK